MDFSQLACFDAVAEHLNFSIASDYVHISQPALSRRIQSLENELGIRLFERNQHTVKLTSQGKEILPLAKKILNDCNAMQLHAERMKAGKVGKLDIGYISNLRSWVHPIIEPFRKKYPDIHITLTKMGYSSILAGLDEGTIDMAICFTRILENDVKRTNPTIMERVIGLTKHELVAPSSMEFQTDEEGRIPFEAIKGIPLVILNHLSAPLVQQRLISLSEKHGFIPNIIMEVDSPDDVYALVESGFGATLANENSNVIGSPKMKQYSFSDENPSLPVLSMWSKYSDNSSLKLLLRFMDENESKTEKE